MTSRARIVRAAQAERATQLQPLRPSQGLVRRISREELEARLTAERVVQEARSQAAAIVEQARKEAGVAAAEVAREAREHAETRVAAQWLHLRYDENTRLARSKDQIIAVSVALAERLLGAALALQPQRIAELARVAIDEARGARRIGIDAHPLDADMLRQSLSDIGLDSYVVEIHADEELARGELRLQTDVGTIDAKLATRLERLAAALRDALA
jgi:flagellar biosynthesis/type III secretory pathway protein FliH